MTTTTTKTPLGTFCWSELGTTDRGRARAFYTRLFGWQTGDQDMGEAGVYTLLRVGSDDIGGMYELAGPMFAGVPSHWMFYVSVADVDAIAAKTKNLGGKIVVAPMDVPGVGRIAMLEDPQGAKFAVFRGDGHPGASADPTTPGAFCWFELHARDLQRAERFYRALFGWSVKRSAKGDPMQYTEWTAPGGEQPFGGMLALGEGHGDAPPAWLGYVTVVDTDAAVAKASALGGNVVVPATDIEGVGRFAVLADPTGAAFAVIRVQLTPEHVQGKQKASAAAKPRQQAASRKKPPAKKAPAKKATKKKPAKKPAKKAAKKKAKTARKPIARSRKASKAGKARKPARKAPKARRRARRGGRS